MSLRHSLLLGAVLMLMPLLAACRRKDPPEPPTKSEKLNVYPHPDAMPGAPPPAIQPPETPAKPASSKK